MLKSDTEYFTDALNTWCKKHRVDATLPLSANNLSQILLDAQALKLADKAKLESANG